MATTEQDLALDADWVLLSDSHPALVTGTVTIQNRGGGDVDVVAGGATAPADRVGTGLDTLDFVKLPLGGNIWLRSTAGSVVSITSAE